jgi:hypothetical protein
MDIFWKLLSWKKRSSSQAMARTTDFDIPQDADKTAAFFRPSLRQYELDQVQRVTAPLF